MSSDETTLWSDKKPLVIITGMESAPVTAQQGKCQVGVKRRAMWLVTRANRRKNPPQYHLPQNGRTNLGGWTSGLRRGRVESRVLLQRRGQLGRFIDPFIMRTSLFTQSSLGDGR